MSVRLVLLAAALVAVTELVGCQDVVPAGGYDTQSDNMHDGNEDSEHIRDKRQAEFMTEKDELRRACLIKSRQACCSLLKKDAQKFAACVKDYSWSNKNPNQPGCPGYPRCPGFTRG